MLDNIPREMTYGKVQDEVFQSHSVRANLYKELEKALGGKTLVVSLFTSFNFPVLLQDPDADMLEEVLQNSVMDKRELVVLLNSPGGEALPAERIVNICRSYSTNTQFSVIVPKMAKSAATMVCLGADKLIMSRTSELGPIDPQIPVLNEAGQVTKYQPAHEILESYDDLFKEATQAQGRIEPFLQQLARFDARDIRAIKSAQDLSESIAIKCLKNGIFKRFSEKTIKNKIKPFLDPKVQKDHGRPIYHDVASRCGLNLELIDNTDDKWKLVWHLYTRLAHVVNTNVAKIIESSDESYTMPLPR